MSNLCIAKSAMGTDVFMNTGYSTNSSTTHARTHTHTCTHTRTHRIVLCGGYYKIRLVMVSSVRCAWCFFLCKGLVSVVLAHLSGMYKMLSSSVGEICVNSIGGYRATYVPGQCFTVT